MPVMWQVLCRMEGREEEEKKIVSLFRNSIIILLSFGIVILFIMNYPKEIIRDEHKVYTYECYATCKLWKKFQKGKI